MLRTNGALTRSIYTCYEAIAGASPRTPPRTPFADCISGPRARRGLRPLRTFGPDLRGEFWFVPH